MTRRFWLGVAFRGAFLGRFGVLLVGVLERSTFDCAMAWLLLLISTLLRDEFDRA